MELTGNCKICGRKTQRTREEFGTDFYCSLEHFQIGQNCYSIREPAVEVFCTDPFGYSVVAAKSFKEGEEVIVELPMLVGPRQKSVPICVGCLNFVDIEKLHLCRRCGWPLCSPNCEDNINHFAECFYTTKCGLQASPYCFVSPQPFYSCVLVLRCLYQMYYIPGMREKLKSLANQYARRITTTKHETHTQQVVNILYNYFYLDKEFVKQDIQKICWIIAVHEEVIRTGTKCYTGIYELASLVEHSCRANCYKVVSSGGLLRIIAGVPIKKGDRLTVCRVSPLLTTTVRQRYLQEFKFFTCTCERCADVTEFRTNFSAIKCKNNKFCGGNLYPKSFLARISEWACNKCNFKLTPGDVGILMKCVDGYLTNINIQSYTDLQTFINDFNHVVPEYHGYMISVKLHFVALKTRLVQGRSEMLCYEDLMKQQAFCRQIIGVLQVIAPAERLIKGGMLVYLQQLLEDICHIKQDLGKLSSTDYRHMLQDSRSLLSEAMECFKYETDGVEENLRHIAVEKLMVLNQILAT